MMSNRKKSFLLHTLVDRGDQISILNGELIIRPYSNKEVPGTWITKNRANVVREIASLLGLDVYAFESYSTGQYGKHKSQGINLQFISLTTGKCAFVIFNAELKRVRNTKNNSAGELLPKGQFRISKKYIFYKFWLSTGLKLPPRLAVFHSYMGNLKSIYFLASPDEQGKITNKIIPRLNVKNEQIVERLNSNHSDNLHTTNGQVTDNTQTALTYKETPAAQVNKGTQSNLTTCINNYGTRLHGNRDISSSVSTDNKERRPQDQTSEEWLEDYNNA
jgi:hypothetical protein